MEMLEEQQKEEMELAALQESQVNQPVSLSATQHIMSSTRVEQVPPLSERSSPFR